MTSSISSPISSFHKLGADQKRFGPGLNASPSFVRKNSTVHASPVRGAASSHALEASASKLNVACTQHQNVLVQQGASDPEYLGSVNTDHLHRRCGAMIETHVHRHLESGEISMVEVARGVGPGKPRVTPLSSLSIKPDGRVVRDGKLVTPDNRDLAKIQNQITAMKESVVTNKLQRRPDDIRNNNIAPPWSASNRLSQP